MPFSSIGSLAIKNSRINRRFCALIAMGIVLMGCAQTQPLDLQTVMKKHVSAAGGKVALQQVRSYRVVDQLQLLEPAGEPVVTINEVYVDRRGVTR